MLKVCPSEQKIICNYEKCINCWFDNTCIAKDAVIKNGVCQSAVVLIENTNDNDSEDTK